MHFLSRHRSLLIGLLVALLLTATMNAPFLRVLITGEPFATVHMGIKDDDRAYYLSRIREVAEGNVLIGNSALKEQSGEISPNGFIEIPSGLLMRFFGLSLNATITLTNLLFPFLIILLTFGWLRGLLKSDLLAVTALLCIWVQIWGITGLLRESSPKAVLLLPSLYLCILFIPQTQGSLHRIARGALIGLMLYTYHYHWTFLAAFEGLLVLHAVFVRRAPWKQIFTETLAVWVPFIFIAIPYGVRLIATSGNPVAIDMWRRFGMIPARSVAAPRLQGTLLAWLIAVFVLRKTSLERSLQSFFLLLLLLAGLIAVNSNLITGKEAEFEGHYGRILRFFTTAALFLSMGAVFRQRTAKIICSILIALTVALGVTSIPRTLAWATENEKLWQEAQTEEILTWLDRETKPQSVILAPYRLASLIPVFTDNYVWMSYAARSYLVSEQELLERYIVQIAFFPEDKEPIETGVMSVFGSYPGSLYSRTKRMHQFRTLFQVPFTKIIPDFIVDQKRRARMESALQETPWEEVKNALQTYELDYVLAAAPLPASLQKQFEPISTLENFTLYKSR